LLIHLTHDIRPLIKLPFNTPKSTRVLDTLSMCHRLLAASQQLCSLFGGPIPNYCMPRPCALVEQAVRLVPVVAATICLGQYRLRSGRYHPGQLRWQHMVWSGTDCHWGAWPIVRWQSLIGPYFQFEFKN
jgi:hypothetical protein